MWRTSQTAIGGRTRHAYPGISWTGSRSRRSARVARMPWGQELPLAPFFGNFGIAPPPAWGRLSSKEPRAFGGNMDNKELGAGSTVYFPVFVPGALFSAGDGHAKATVKSA